MLEIEIMTGVTRDPVPMASDVEIIRKIGRKDVRVATLAPMIMIVSRDVMEILTGGKEKITVTHAIMNAAQRKGTVVLCLAEMVSMDVLDLKEAGSAMIMAMLDPMVKKKDHLIVIDNGAVIDMVRIVTGLAVVSLNKSRNGWIQRSQRSRVGFIPRKTFSAGRKR